MSSENIYRPETPQTKGSSSEAEDRYSQVKAQTVAQGFGTYLSNHRQNVVDHAAEVVRDDKMKRPSDRVLGNDPDMGPATRAPEVGELGTADKMLQQMARMTVGARRLGEAAELLCHIIKSDCNLILTMSGAASMGQLDLLIAEMIDRGYIKAVVTTGAIVTHGTSLEMGRKHFQVPEEAMDESADVALYNRGYNRVYDTVEIEKSLESTGDLVVKVLKNWDHKCITSWEIHREMGCYLCEYHSKEDGILHAAYRSNVPVYVPSFTDSEIGLSYARYMMENSHPVKFNAFGDLEDYADLVKSSSKDLAILTLGGGVPRNWAQQIAPFFDTLIDRGLVKMKPIRFKYGIRICPEFTEWGGLSGCTYSEGISWGKFTPTNEGGKYVEVYSDYTTIFPLLVRGVFERLGISEKG